MLFGGLGLVLRISVKHDMGLKDVGKAAVLNIPEAEPFPLLTGVVGMVAGSVETDDDIFAHGHLPGNVIFWYIQPTKK